MLQDTGNVLMLESDIMLKSLITIMVDSFLVSQVDLGSKAHKTIEVKVKCFMLNLETLMELGKKLNAKLLMITKPLEIMTEDSFQMYQKEVGKAQLKTGE